LGAYIYTGHAIVTRSITESYRIIGSVSGAAANARGLELSGMYAYPPAKYAQGTWHLIESGGNATPVRIGIAGKETLDMTDVTATATMRRAKRIAGETQTSERGPPARSPTTPNSGPNVTVANSNFGAGLAGSA